MKVFIEKFLSPVPIVVLIMVLAGGCVASVENLRVKKYVRYKAAEDYKKALAEIRAEIKTPVAPKDKVYLININSLGIDALANYAGAYELGPGMDAEVLGYYDTVLKNAGGMGAYVTQANRMMTQYYHESGRDGLSLPYLQKNLDYYRSIDNIYQQINSLNDFATTYSNMGQLELQKHYLDQALKMGQRYFILGKQPLDEGHWLGYKTFLKNRMDLAARPGNSAAVWKLWETMEPIVKKYITPESLSYSSTAVYLAACGDLKGARKLMAQAESLMLAEAAEKPRVKNDFICSQGQVALHAGEKDRAAGLMDKCLDDWHRRGRDPGETTYRIAGLAFEKAGDYDRAMAAYRQSIRRSERSRSSFPVASRATFFRSSVRRAYWGLVRCLIHKHNAGADPNAFIQALQAAEQVRGRQFGDLIDPGGTDTITAGDLAGFRAGLPADQAVLAYLLTDQDIILFAFSRDRQMARVLPYDSNAFRKRIMAAAAGLADPNSDIDTLQSRLTAITPVVLGPAGDMVRAKKKLVVLSDGALNALPFDVLSAASKGYQPLITTHVVQMAPSFKYLVQARKKETPPATGLFALADPVYTSSGKIGDLSREQLESVTRGSRYLSYFTPLPETRTEVEGISALFSGMPVKTLYGSKACESAVKETDLSIFKYIHIATHGILGNDVPGLNEPALVMAEEHGEDCFLTASEAQKLSLNADLAVLSACNTGTGKYFTGEGVMGMSRAFLLAGSRSVLVSLWSVPSKETEMLMLSFYKNLQGGQSIPVAIRNAKLEIMNSSGSGQSSNSRGVAVTGKMKQRGPGLHPVFWAAFIPLGG